MTADLVPFPRWIKPRARAVLAADAWPDLVAAVPAAEQPAAIGATLAPLRDLPLGPWSARMRVEPGALGLLLLDGVVVRSVRAGARTSIELLGEGDLVRPWEPTSDAGDAAGWTVLVAGHAALLDRAFAVRTARFPEVAAAVVEAGSQRSRRLGRQLALSQLPGLRTRLHGLLWHLADRWGRVTPSGVVVPVPLTHAQLGAAVGARRPAVTTTLGRLAAERLILRRPDGGWLLRGDPPALLDEAGGGAQVHAIS